MAKPVIDNLTKEVSEATTVMQSATTLINGFKARLDAAVATALENGATAEELAPLTGLSTDLDTNANALASAVEANT